MTAGARVAVFGASGLVGRELLSLLEERRFPVAALTAYASESSAGESVAFAGDEVSIQETPSSFPRFDVAFLCCPADVARSVAPALIAGGATVVDLSPAHRDAVGAKLALAGDVASQKGTIVALPDPLTTLLVLVLRPLLARAAVERVVATAIVSASAAGQSAVERLGEQTAALLNGRESDDETSVAFDCVPLIGDGERFFAAEVKRDVSRLLEQEIALGLNVVRAPIFHGQGVAITVVTETEIDAKDVESWFRDAPSLVVAPSGVTPTSIRGAAGGEAVHIGLVRADGRTLSFWAASDNVRQAGALTAVSVAEVVLRAQNAH